jgi:membrane glycosyltransferase
MDQPGDKSFEISRRGAFSRRLALLLLIAGPTIVASGYMAYTLPHGGTTPMEILVLAMFVILYAWISLGFWTAMAGWAILVRGSDRYDISRICQPGKLPDISTKARTAVIMPIYNEDPAQVVQCLGATISSLAVTGRVGHFDFFLLSDPGDPEIWLREEMAWADLRHYFRDAPCRIFYRRRKDNDRRKSGNVADFCKQWGLGYRYMIPLDADSVMEGETMVRMVHVMECRPAIGILQSPPRIVGRQTLIARTQQFASGLYGKMFAAGLNFWQLGDSQFWGHNAVIRVEPFMEHCDLPRLPGKPPLGGDILSHDFVEAALMRRAGYEVWLAYDMEGSYEQPPPTLLNELKRDNRWCQGNLQHLRLLFTRGIRGIHRALFVNGAMAYGSALCWFLFLAASSVMAIMKNIREPDYFPEGRSLFPQWPVWEPQWALVLLASTGVILFLPKLLHLLVVFWKKRDAALFGGRARLFASFLGEIIISTLLAPTRMLFHAKFVFFTLLGRKISWEAQERGDVGTPWGDAVRFHLGGTIFAMCWGAVVFAINRSFFWWLSPILISLVVAIPLSVWFSRKRTGLWFKDLGLMLIPEETRPPQVLEAAGDFPTRGPFMERLFLRKGEAAAFITCVVDPKIYTLHIRLLKSQEIEPADGASRLAQYREKALEQGPLALSSAEKQSILSDADSLRHLHEAVWKLSGPEISRRWQLSGE